MDILDFAPERSAEQDRSLQDAADAVSPTALQAALRAILERAESLNRMLGLLESGLDRVRTPEEADRFARAVALYEMAYLPVRPETCPFCQEYADDRCGECGYARTHGGICNRDSSSFVAFIEALNLLGTAVKAIPDPSIFTSQPKGDFVNTKEILQRSIDDAAKATAELIRDLLTVDDETPSKRATSYLMDQKAMYLRRMIRIMPLAAIHSPEPERLCREVLSSLERYW